MFPKHERTVSSKHGGCSSHPRFGQKAPCLGQLAAASVLAGRRALTGSRARSRGPAPERNLIGSDSDHGRFANEERNAPLGTHVWSLRYSLTSARLVGENMFETFMARIK